MIGLLKFSHKFYFNIGGSKNCTLGPFQFIPYRPYSQNKPNRKFSDIDNPTVMMKNCSLRKVLVKFPDKAREIELQWLDESYVDLNVSSNDIYFKVRITKFIRISL
jgi:hypothetical protein